MPGLTPDIVRALRAPFDAEQIKWKVQTNPKEGDTDMMAVVVCYLDARDVAERLDLATGGDWSNDYAQPQATSGNGVSLECRLTVCGVTRVDVGTVAHENNGDNTKDLYSDALKRAAVQFGVGSHIYRFPTVKAKVEKFGRSFFLTFDAQRELLALTRAILNGDAPAKYKDVKVRGSAYGAEGGTRDEVQQEPERRPVQGAAPRVRPTSPAAQQAEPDELPPPRSVAPSAPTALSATTRATTIASIRANMERAKSYGFDDQVRLGVNLEALTDDQLSKAAQTWKQRANDLAAEVAAAPKTRYAESVL